MTDRYWNVVAVNGVAGAVLATQGSTLWNFLLSERWVFRGRDHALGIPARVETFFAMNNLALLLRIPLLYALVSGLGFNHLLANVMSLLALPLAAVAAIGEKLSSTRPFQAP